MIYTLDLIARRLLIILVAAYRVVVSGVLPPSCRFYPSCSQYALDALRSKPLPKALWVIVRRILRCHPLHPGGYDPVPGHRD